MPVSKTHEEYHVLNMNNGWRISVDCPPRAPLSPNVHKALSYMRANVEQSISVDEIAKTACCSPSTLQRAFRRQFGTSPIAMLRRFRIDIARDRLGSGDYSTVMDVMTSLGISNPGRFAAEFRKQTGRLPSELIRLEPDATDVPTTPSLRPTSLPGRSSASSMPAPVS